MIPLLLQGLSVTEVTEGYEYALKKALEILPGKTFTTETLIWLEQSGVQLNIITMVVKSSCLK